MSTKADIPESLRAELSRAGTKRMDAMTPAERTALARKAWEARVAKHQTQPPIARPRQRQPVTMRAVHY